MSKVKDKNGNQRKWRVVSLLTLVIQVAAYLIIAMVYTEDRFGVGNTILGILLYMLIVVGFVAMLIAITAAYKLKGFIKLLPIGSILVSSCIIGATLFAIALESFANSH